MTCMEKVGKNRVKPKSVKSSRSVIFCKIGGLENFAKFTGKYLCHGLKLQALSLKLYPKKESATVVFL